MAHLDLLKEWLKTIDETQLCELLDISTEEIIDRFSDLIYQRRKYLEKEMEIIALDEGEELDFDN